MTSLLSWFASTEQIRSAPLCKNGPCDICIQVASVDEDINRAISNLRHLIDKRCNLRSEQNRIHGLVQRLPVEICNHIFELLLPLRNKWGQVLPFQESSAEPTYLASICRSWRDIAWSNPSYWSTINIAIGLETPGPNGRLQVDLVRDWIQRSRTLPLTLRIFARERQLGQEEEFKTVIDVINQCSNRWHSLSISMPLKLLRAFDQYGNLQYHHLKRLQIISGANGPQYGDGINLPLPFLLNSTASPEEVALCGVPFRSLLISWNHLFIASVADCELQDITRVLQHAPQMTECYILSPNDTRNLSMPPINHRNLRKLSLTDGRGRFVAATLLRSLTLPNLQTFCTSETYLLSPGYLPALMQRSSCPLTRIELLGEFGKFEESSSMQPFPGVTDLFLGTLHGRRVVQDLLFKGHFPHLRRLIIPLQLFFLLTHIFSELVDRQLPWPNGRRLRKIIIEEEKYDGARIWQAIKRDLKGIDAKVTESSVEIFCAGEDG